MQSGAEAQSTHATRQPSQTQGDAHAEHAGLDPRSTAFHSRIEPTLDESGFPSAANTAYERLHGLGPDFGEYRPPGRSRMWRVTTMLGVFVVGAGVGLLGAWWLHRPGTVIAAPASAVRLTPAMSGSPGGRPVVMRGISPSELPYDGAPPPVSDAPPAKLAAGTSAREPRQAETAGVEDDRQSARASTQASESAVSAASKPRAPSKSPADREIERIRRQADEELKKKTEQGRALRNSRKGAHLTSGREAAGKVAVKSPASREASTREMLVRCDRSASLVHREICRWRVCNGSWGKYGCPSYKAHTPNY